VSERLVVGDLDFEVRRSPRRRTLEITVERDGTLVLRVPEACPPQRLENFARDRELWVQTRLAEREPLAPAARPREYVSGESFFYLGREHRLVLVEDREASPLRLRGSQFKLRRDQAHRGRFYFIRWYTRNAKAWLRRCVRAWQDRLEVKPTAVEVQDLGNRWGSCGTGGRLNFHWKTILLPPTAVEYVVVHEMVHLLVPDHSRDFWTRLERAMPDWRSRKDWLAREGGRYVL